MKVSCSVIAKNEGATIYRMLESCELFVDEYVIGIDNTTTDNTYDEINRFSKCTSIPVRTYSYTWNNDFSKARNENIDLCTGDYIFIIDGHEYLDERCIQKLLQIKHDPKGFGVFLFDIVMHQNGKMSKFMQARLFKNAYRYHNKSHNVLLFEEKDAARLTNCEVHHKRPETLTEARSQQRRDMNIADLKDRIKNGDRRAEAQIATEYMSWHEWDNAIDALNRYIKQPVHSNELYQVRINLAMSYYHAKKYDDSEKILFECFNDNPENRNAHLMCLASLYYECGRYFKAMYFATWASTFKPPEQYFFLYPTFYTTEPWNILRKTYEKIGYADGVQECEKVLSRMKKTQGSDL